VNILNHWSFTLTRLPAGSYNFFASYEKTVFFRKNILEFLRHFKSLLILTFTMKKIEPTPIMKNTEPVNKDVAYHAKRIVSLNLRIILENK
jgi:hypothetical protein